MGRKNNRLNLPLELVTKDEYVCNKMMTAEIFSFLFPKIGLEAGENVPVNGFE